MSNAKPLDLSLPYQVADISLADFGKKEMQLSEREMPGLMELIRRYGDKKPLKGFKVMGSLHMTIQTAVHHHRTLYVHLVAHLEQTQITAVQGFLHGGNGIGAVFYFHYGEADAVVRHALVDAEFINERALQRKVDVLLIMSDSYDGSHFFYDSTKHIFYFIWFHYYLKCKDIALARNSQII